MKTKNLWYSFTAILVICFSVLGFYGHEIYREKPPIPKKVISADGTVIFTEQEIKDGQNVWQSIGGQEVGTVWGHGAYVAPDWSADWLHKETVYLSEKWAEKDFNSTYTKLDAENQAVLKVRLQKLLRSNTYNSSTGIIVVSNDRAEAIKDNCSHYTGLFMNDPALDKERQAMQYRQIQL
jgi:nitric oxide reductase subunit B